MKKGTCRLTDACVSESFSVFRPVEEELDFFPERTPAESNSCRYFGIGRNADIMRLLNDLIPCLPDCFNQFIRLIREECEMTDDSCFFGNISAEHDLQPAVSGFRHESLLPFPDDFQSAEYLEKHGFIDRIVKRSELKPFIAKMLGYWGF